MGEERLRVLGSIFLFSGKTPVMISEDAKYDDGVVQEQVKCGGRQGWFIIMFLLSLGR